MKLIIIIAVSDFTSEIRQLLIRSGASSFSYREVIGFSAAATGSPFDNWFATADPNIGSVLFFAFAENKIADAVYEQFKEFNSLLETGSVIHLASLTIDKIL